MSGGFRELFQPQMPFEQDKQIGSGLERVLVENFRFYNIHSHLNPGETLDEKQKYDFIFEPGGKRMLGEAKLDLQSCVTGNLCLEEATLNHSQADYFFHSYLIVKVFNRDEYRTLFMNSQKKLVGDNKLPAALVRYRDIQVGQPLWAFMKTLKNGE